MRKITFILLCLVFTTTAFSQIRNLRLGISGEVFSLSYMSSDTPLIETGRFNFSQSIFIRAEYYYSPFISISTGIGITRNQGGVLRYNEGGDVWADSDLVPNDLHNLAPGAELRSKIQYLEIPAALKLRTDEFGRTRVFFEVPRFTLGVTTRGRGDVLNGENQSKNQNIYPSMSWLNLSYGLMGGIEYSLNQNISAILGLHWKQGFVDVTDDSGVDSKITTGTFGFHVGILF